MKAVNGEYSQFPSRGNPTDPVVLGGEPPVKIFISLKSERTEE